MLDAFLQGVIAPFQPHVFLFVLAGLIISAILGAIPGIGAFHVFAMLLPLAFVLPPEQGLAFLASLTVAGSIGGAVTSILFGVPGTATNVATILEGYPMTQKGEGARAVGAAMASSGLGGMLGGIMILPLIPVIQPLVLSFKSPEIFLVILLGILFIAELGREDPLRALIAGVLGLLLSTVGMHPYSGVYRFTFDQLFLFEGLPLIPVIMGLFTVPAAIELALNPPASVFGKEEIRLPFKDMLEGVKDLFRNFGIWLRATLIGCFTGLIPGIGSVVGIWLAYGHAKQSSPRGDQFGSGCVEGVLATESANESGEASAFLTTVAFGIPGSATWAVLIGAFMLAGLPAGPGMLWTLPEISFTLLWIIIWGNALAALGVALFATQIARLAYFPSYIIAPSLLVFAFLSTYLAREDIGHFVILILASALGYAMTRYQYSKASFIIGFILGGMAERNYEMARAAFGPFFMFSSPVAWILFLLCVGTIIYRPVLKRIRPASRPLHGEN
ncbi:MAG: hypothetical protein GTO40_29410 [Deltaproteobacteria bacterium]|nr:hypothetical protein [Deltaproteobacteria bacterium]